MITAAVIGLGALVFLAGFAAYLGICAGEDGYRDLPGEKNEEVKP